MDIKELFIAVFGIISILLIIQQALLPPTAFDYYTAFLRTKDYFRLLFKKREKRNFTIVFCTPGIQSHQAQAILKGIYDALSKRSYYNFDIIKISYSSLDPKPEILADALKKADFIICVTSFMVDEVVINLPRNKEDTPIYALHIPHWYALSEHFIEQATNNRIHAIAAPETWDIKLDIIRRLFKPKKIAVLQVKKIADITYAEALNRGYMLRASLKEGIQIEFLHLDPKNPLGGIFDRNWEKFDVITFSYSLLIREQAAKIISTLKAVTNTPIVHLDTSDNGELGYFVGIGENSAYKSGEAGGIAITEALGKKQKEKFPKLYIKQSIPVEGINIIVNLYKTDARTLAKLNSDELDNLAKEFDVMTDHLLKDKDHHAGKDFDGEDLA